MQSQIKTFEQTQMTLEAKLSTIKDCSKLKDQQFAETEKQFEEFKAEMQQLQEEKGKPQQELHKKDQEFKAEMQQLQEEKGKLQQELQKKDQEFTDYRKLRIDDDKQNRQIKCDWEVKERKYQQELKGMQSQIKTFEQTQMTLEAKLSTIKDCSNKTLELKD
eukprot:62206_1